MLTNELKAKMIESALLVRKNAYAPYSGYAVGACLLSKSGKLFSGVNVENAAYPTGTCAERVAVFKAVSEGEMEFEAIVVAIRRDIMDDHWLGRRIDEAFVEGMERRGIDPCGENGEYHTLVVDGPIFSKRIEIGEARVTKRGTMAFLQVLSFALRRKS